MDSTGKLVMPLSAKNMDMNTAPWPNMGRYERKGRMLFSRMKAFNSSLAASSVESN